MIWDEDAESPENGLVRNEAHDTAILGSQSQGRKSITADLLCRPHAFEDIPRLRLLYLVMESDRISRVLVL